MKMSKKSRYIPAPIPENEDLRLQALYNLAILDTEPEDNFDEITQLVAELCSVPIALVSLVDKDRQWFKSSCGLDATQTGRAESFCGHAILEDQLFEVPDTLEDERFAENPLVTGGPQIRFYAGMPLVDDNGVAYGTLCVIDTKPNLLNELQRTQLMRLAKMVVRFMNMRRERQQSEDRFAEIQMQVDQFPAAIISCDETGRLKNFNSLARQWHGVDPLRIPPEQWSEYFDLYESDGKTLLALEKIPLRRAYMGHNVKNEEIIIKAKGQPLRRVKCFGSPFFSHSGELKGAVINMIDVTHQVQNQQFMKAVIDASLDVAIIATDTEGLITLFNSGAEKLLGYASDEMVDKQTPAAFHDLDEIIAHSNEIKQKTGRDVEGFEVFVDAAKQGKSEIYNWTYICKDGRRRQVRLSVSALFDDAMNINGFLGMAVDVTEQKEAEKSAALAIERFQGAFNASGFGMALVSLKGEWLEVNDSICQMFGYSAEQLKKLTFQELTHPDDLEEDLALLEQLVNGDITSYRLQKRYFRSDGAVFFGNLAVSLVRDVDDTPLHFVSQINDVTAEMEAQNQINENENRLNSLFQLSPIGILLSDLTMETFFQVNPSLLAPSGYSNEEFLALDNAALTPKDYAKPDRKAMNELLETGQYPSYEKEFFRKDGSRYPVRLQGFLITDVENNQRVWSFIQDISEEKATQQLKNSFVSTVSHELRTPLTSIKGALELIQGGVLGEIPASMQEMISVAFNNSYRLNHLVNDLLDFEKLVAGKMQLNIKAVSIVPVLQKAINDMKGYASTYQVDIEYEGVDSGVVSADEQRLLQVVNNLLSNACKYSHPDGIVRVIANVHESGELVVEIVDQGKGIPKPFRKHIFERFAQADSSDTRQVKGTGLGLAICREIIEQMGGVIGYESEEGVGSNFWFRVPVKTPSAHKKEGRKLRILHVEDDEHILMLIKAELGPFYDMFQAQDLHQANALLRGYDFDLILLDLKLPDGHGISLWESLQVSQPHVPIIVVSGYEIPQEMAMSVSGIVSKKQLNGRVLSSKITRLFSNEKDYI